MQERIQSHAKRLMEKWNSLERKQQIAIASISLAIVLMIGLTVYLMTRPTYSALYDSLDPITRRQLEETFIREGIKYRTTRAGVIEVQEEDWSRAASYAIQADIPPLKGLTLADATAGFSMSTSGKVIDATLIEVKKLTINERIMLIDGVTYCDVDLDLPPEDNWLRTDNPQGSASVTVQTSRPFGRDEGEVIAYMVASGFTNLPVENVMVFDTNGEILYSGVSADSPSAAISDQHEFKRSEENRIKTGLKELFKRYGYDAFIQSNLVFDFSVSATDSYTVTSPLGEGENTGIISQEEIYKSDGTTYNTDAEPGVGTNNLETPEYDMETGALQDISVSDIKRVYDSNTETRRVEDHTYGKMMPEQSSLAVILYGTRRYNQATITEDQLNGLTWEQFKDANAYPDDSVEVSQQIIDIIRSATGINEATVLIVETPEFIDLPEVEPVSYRMILLLVVLAIFMILLAYMAIKGAQPDEITEIEPELSVEDLLVSTQLDEEKEQEARKLQELQEIEYFEDSEIKKQIVKFVDEKPEAAAQLLRNWINEDWD